MAPSNVIDPTMQPKIFNVLVVDDSQSDLDLATIHLSKAWPFDADMAIDTARDGLEALEMMRGKQFCLILLDWCMPKGGNGQVLRDLRRNGVYIPVVVLSGLERNELPDDLEAEGAAYLNKQDLDASTLRGAIAEALRLQPSPSASHCDQLVAISHSPELQASVG